MGLTLAQMLALLPDNTAGDISAADARDVVTGLFGFNLIERQALAVDTASFDFQSIPDSYESLRLIYHGRGAAATNGNLFVMRFNNDSGANYDYETNNSINGGHTGANFTGQTSIGFMAIPKGSSTADRPGSGDILIPGYARTVFHKVTRATGTDYITSVLRVTGGAGVWKSTAAITRITIAPDTGNWLAGSVASLYGIG